MLVNSYLIWAFFCILPFLCTILSAEAVLHSPVFVLSDMREDWILLVETSEQLQRDTHTHKSRTKKKSHTNKQTRQQPGGPPFPLFHQLYTLDTPEQKKLTLSAGRSSCLNYTLCQLKAFLLVGRTRRSAGNRNSLQQIMSRPKDKHYVTETLGVTLWAVSSLLRFPKSIREVLALFQSGLFCLVLSL